MGKDLAKQKVSEWYFSTIEERGSKTRKALAKELDVTKETITRWIKEFKGQDGQVSTYERQLNDILTSLHKSGTGGNARAAELWLKHHGELTEKSEVKVEIGLSADEITRRNLRAEQELREFGGTTGHRVEEVSEERPILPESVLLHSNKVEAGQNS